MQLGDKVTHTCCKALNQVSRCQWRGFWSSWCHRSHQDSTADSHPSIAEHEKRRKKIDTCVLTPGYPHGLCHFKSQHETEGIMLYLL